MNEIKERRGAGGGGAKVGGAKRSKVGGFAWNRKENNGEIAVIMRQILTVTELPRIVADNEDRPADNPRLE